LSLPIPVNLAGLVKLARERGVDVNPTLLRLLTDFYVQRPAHSADEEREFTELALRLFETVDDDTLKVVARKLLAHPATPPAVIARLARAGFARAAAAPPNTEAKRDVGAGPDPLAGETFLSAGSAERRHILATLAAAPPSSPPPTDAHAAVRQLETCALTGKPSEFTRILASTLGISQALAQRIVNDPSGEPLLVAAKALAMPRDVFQRIVLVLNPAVGHSVRRVYDLSDLYPDVTVRQALHLLGSWRAGAPEEAVKVVVYPSGRWADWIVAASSGVSTDPTWAAHLRASVRQHCGRSDRRAQRSEDQGS